ncbi:nitrous oxide reductase accessory protein NosL [Pistricoccus aurantiacus]|uniref:nitrous oxide reductase accessory protein NosL n=1 Tax=Pistricoccus aurantiacus TaxID=1883414 RepID=UPI003631F7C2
MRRFSLLAWCCIALLGFFLLGCDDTAEPTTLAAPEPIVAEDTCHVCGMTIVQFPGPKGEAFLKGNAQALKFCSTLELFTFLQQPENQTQLSHAYVHDMGQTPWASPSDDAFIRAVDAWYVVGHDQRGAMGHTLAPFAEQAEAQAFIDEHGGEMIRYADIDLPLLGKLGRGELNAETP